MFWRFLICIQKIWDLGQEVVIVRVAFSNRMKGLVRYLDPLGFRGFS